MKKAKMNFEQVSLDVVKNLVAGRFDSTASGSLTCRICGNPLQLEDCKADEMGRAVHGPCYLSTLVADAAAGQRRTIPIA